MSNQPLVEVENLNVDFPLGRSLLGKPPMLRAVNDVSLKIMPQTFFGLVGESGSGKTTLGRAMLRAAPITSGTISFNHGNTKYDVGAMSKIELKEYRKQAQLIFQDPYAALNPRMTVRDIIAEPLEVMELVQTREEADQKVRGVVNLPEGTGKAVKVAVFARDAKAKEAEAAGADIVGSDDLAEKVKSGKFDFDRVISTPEMMAVVGQLGKVLGPKGLMPNPKLGTVTDNISDAVKNIKGGSVEYLSLIHI